MKNFRLIIPYLALAAAFVTLPVRLFASGVNADSIIENVQVGTGKNAQKYVLMNSQLNEHQWYCARMNPELVETGLGKSAEPDLTFIRFQKMDSKDPEKIAEGGILNFSFVIGPDQATLLALRKKLPKNIDQRLARIDPLPLSGIEMNLFDPRGKKIQLIATAPQGIASDYSSQFARFSALFSSVDADLIEPLITKSNGLGYELNYRYVALSPKQKINVRVDFARLASKDRQKAESAIVESDGVTLDAALLSYLKRQARNPRVSQRLKSAAQHNSSSSASDNMPVDPRDYGKKKHKEDSAPKISDLTKNVTLIHRTREQKVLAAKGFLSLAEYPDEIRKKRIINDTSYDNWKKAWLIMPSVGELPDLVIDRIVLKATLADKRYTYDTRSYVWTPEKQWLDEFKAPATIADFSLKDVLAAGPDALEKAFFKLEYSIFSSDALPVTGSDILPVVTGDIPVTAPMELADILMFDFSHLYWDAPETDKKRLIKIELNLQDDRRKFSRFVAPRRRADKVMIYPEQMPVMLTRGNFAKPGKVKASIFFHTADGKRVPWDFNGMDLSEPFSGNYITFLDNDWQIER